MSAVGTATASTLPYVGRNARKVRDISEEILAVGQPGEVDRRITIIEADAGVGKTRFLQEVYEELVRHQPDGPPFWAPGLAPLRPSSWDDLLVGPKRLSLSRKMVGPAPVVATGAPSFLWLGLSCMPRGDAEQMQLLAGVSSQLVALQRIGQQRDALGRTAREQGLDLALDIGQKVVKLIPGIKEVGDSLEILGSVHTWTRSAIQLWRAMKDTSLGALSQPQAFAEHVGELLAELPDLYRRRNRPAPPLVLAIDDAHDLDDESAAFLSALIRESSRSAGLPIVVLATTWDEREWGDGVTQLFDDLTDDGVPVEIERLRLGAGLTSFDRSEARELVSSLVPSELPSGVVEALIDRAHEGPEPGCSPLLLVEYLLEAAARRRRGLLELDLSWIDSLPRSVREAGERRFARLVEEDITQANALAGLVALGGTVPSDVFERFAASLAPQGPDEGVTAAEGLRDIHRLIEDDGETVTVSDGRMLETVEQYLRGVGPHALASDESSKLRNLAAVALRDWLRQRASNLVESDGFGSPDDDLWPALATVCVDAKVLDPTDPADQLLLVVAGDGPALENLHAHLVTGSERDLTWVAGAWETGSRLLGSPDKARQRRGVPLVAELLSFLPSLPREQLPVVTGFVRRVVTAVLASEQPIELQQLAAGTLVRFSEQDVNLLDVLRDRRLPDAVRMVVIPLLLELAERGDRTGVAATLLLIDLDSHLDAVDELLAQHAENDADAAVVHYDRKSRRRSAAERLEPANRILGRHAERSASAAARLYAAHLAATREDEADSTEAGSRDGGAAPHDLSPEHRSTERFGELIGHLRRHARRSANAALALADGVQGEDAEVLELLWRHRYSDHASDVARAMLRIAPVSALKRIETFLEPVLVEDPVVCAEALVRYSERGDHDRVCPDLVERLAEHAGLIGKRGRRADIDDAFAIIREAPESTWRAMALDLLARGKEQKRLARAAVDERLRAKDLRTAQHWVNQRRRTGDRSSASRTIIGLERAYVSPAIDDPDRDAVVAADVLLEFGRCAEGRDERTAGIARYESERLLTRALKVPQLHHEAALVLALHGLGGDVAQKLDLRRIDDPTVLISLLRTSQTPRDEEVWGRLRQVAKRSPAAVVELLRTRELTESQTEQVHRLALRHARADVTTAVELLRSTTDERGAVRALVRAHAYSSVTAAISLAEDLRDAGEDLDDSLRLVLERHAMRSAEAAAVLAELTHPDARGANEVRRLCLRHVRGGAVVVVEQLCRLSTTTSQRFEAYEAIASLRSRLSGYRAMREPLAARRRSLLARLVRDERTLGFMAPGILSSDVGTDADGPYERLLAAVDEDTAVAMWLVEGDKHLARALENPEQYREARVRAWSRVARSAEDGDVVAARFMMSGKTRGARAHALRVAASLGRSDLEVAVGGLDLALDSGDRRAIRALTRVVLEWTKKGDRRSEACAAMVPVASWTTLSATDRRGVEEELLSLSRQGDSLARAVALLRCRPPEEMLLDLLENPDRNETQRAKAASLLARHHAVEDADAVTEAVYADLTADLQRRAELLDSLSADLNSWQRAAVLGSLATTSEHRRIALQRLAEAAEEHVAPALWLARLAVTLTEVRQAFSVLLGWAQASSAAAVALADLVQTEEDRNAAVLALDRHDGPDAVEKRIRQNGGRTDVLKGRDLAEDHPTIALAIAASHHADDSDLGRLAGAIRDLPELAREAVLDQVPIDRSPDLVDAIFGAAEEDDALAAELLARMGDEYPDRAEALATKWSQDSGRVAIAWLRVLGPRDDRRPQQFAIARRHADADASLAVELLLAVDGDWRLIRRALTWLVNAPTRQVALQNGAYPLRARLFSALEARAEALGLSGRELEPALVLALGALADTTVRTATVRNLLPPREAADDIALVTMSFIETSAAIRRAVCQDVLEGRTQLDEDVMSLVEIGARAGRPLARNVLAAWSLTTGKSVDEAINLLFQPARDDELSAIQLARLLVDQEDPSPSRLEAAERRLSRFVGRGQPRAAEPLARLALASRPSRVSAVGQLLRQQRERAPGRAEWSEALAVLSAGRQAATGAPPSSGAIPATPDRGPVGPESSPGAEIPDPPPTESSSVPARPPVTAAHRTGRSDGSRPNRWVVLAVAGLLAANPLVWHLVGGADPAPAEAEAVAQASTAPAPISGPCWLVASSLSERELLALGLDPVQLVGGQAAVLARDEATAGAVAQRLGSAATEAPQQQRCEEVVARVPRLLQGDGGRWQVTGAVELNVRTGPGVIFPRLTTLRRSGEAVSGTGRVVDVDGTPWREIVLEGGDRGWSSARYLDAAE